VADLEMVQDEIFTRLARAYGRSKADIARLAIQRYGEGEKMTGETEEVLGNLKSLLQGGRGGDAMEKMMMWEMIRDMRQQRSNPQNAPNYQPQQQLQQPEKGGMPTFQEMFMMMMMPQMVKAMAGGGEKSTLEKVYEYKMLMGDNGKGMDMDKLERMILQERMDNDTKMEQMMNTILGKQEAEKIREREEKWRREMEQRTLINRCDREWTRPWT
jgi:hypothetical protein